MRGCDEGEVEESPSGDQEEEQQGRLALGLHGSFHQLNRKERGLPVSMNCSMNATDVPCCTIMCKQANRFDVWYPGTYGGWNSFGRSQKSICTVGVKDAANEMACSQILCTLVQVLSTGVDALSQALAYPPSREVPLPAPACHFQPLLEIYHSTDFSTE